MFLSGDNIAKNVCRKWKHASLRLELLKNEGAAFRTGSGLYDEALILERTAHLKRVREIGDLYEILFAVRADLLRNIGNIASSTLHKDLLVIPKPIEEYIQEVRSCIQEVSRASAIPIEDRLMFLRETRHAFGRTALVLSGGGSFGAFHLGVIRSLLDASLLPRVLSGSSAGAIVVAVVGTRTRSELKELFASLDDRIKDIDFYSANTASQIARHLLLKGTLQDYRVLQEKLRDLLGEYTFEEAYAQSGIAINVAVSAADTSEPPRLLNYLTAPNVLVWSAVACSSAFPFLYAPQTLLARDSKGRIIPFANKAAGESQRRWRDGSLEEDLPMRGLSEMFNVNYFLVSQCNPYLLPILAAKEALPRTLGVLAEQEFKHRCQQLMELMPRKLGASKFLKLLSQPWEGDVTMVLPVTTLSAVKAVINLSKDDVLLALSEGQKATWKQLSSIAANCNIEVTLDECLRQVTAKASRKRVQQAQWRSSQNNLASRRGIPSWIHLQSLGIPNADSFEGLGASHHQAPQHRIMGSSVPEDLTLMDQMYPIEHDEGQRDVEIMGKSPVEQQDVWKALFEVAPASNALDFIAP